MNIKDILIMKLSGTASYKNEKEIYFPSYRDPISQEYACDYSDETTIQFLNNSSLDYIIRSTSASSTANNYQDIFKNGKANGVFLQFIGNRLQGAIRYVDGKLHGVSKLFNKNGTIINLHYYYNDIRVRTKDEYDKLILLDKTEKNDN